MVRLVVQQLRPEQLRFKGILNMNTGPLLYADLLANCTEDKRLVVIKGGHQEPF